MCRRRGDTIASCPAPRSAIPSSSTPSSFPNLTESSSTAPATSSSSSSLSSSSIATLRNSLPQNSIIFSHTQISSATNNFLSHRFSPSSWRCSLSHRQALIFQRPFRSDPSSFPARLSALSNSHHRNIVPLIGASISPDWIFLVYQFIPGLSLSDSLHNKKNPSFTPLSTWMSRIQIATDLAQGLQYIHNHSAGGGIVHNYIKSSAIIVTEPNFNAMICHFGAAFLSGDLSLGSGGELRRSDSRLRKIDGIRGYLSPEVISGGDLSVKSDVFALGVLLLELLSGEVPIKMSFDREKREYKSVSLIEAAKEVFGEGRRIGVRRWVDKRLKDSFPVDLVEKMMEIALRCVDFEPERRPDMTWVEGKISKIFLSSRVWAETVRAPVDFSVSLAPR